MARRPDSVPACCCFPVRHAGREDGAAQSIQTVAAEPKLKKSPRSWARGPLNSFVKPISPAHHISLLPSRAAATSPTPLSRRRLPLAAAPLTETCALNRACCHGRPEQGAPGPPLGAPTARLVHRCAPLLSPIFSLALGILLSLLPRFLVSP
jgi:hypothetical protein